MISCFRTAILLLFLAACVSTGQSQVRDTLRTPSPPSPRDTSAGPPSAGVDTVVNYSATDSIVYNIQTKFMHLYGKTDLQYQTLGLKAERTTVNWNTMTLTAQGVQDSTDTTGTKSIGLPVLKDGGDVYNGKHVAYNFRTKKGKIDVGDTEMDKGYYHGEEVKKVEPDVLFVENGRFTTCDEKDPHFYFASPKMKVLVRDKVIAEPIYFYVADVPVFALPFGVFPSRGGRSSGIIAPAYGEDSRRGKYLSHFGYFWAASDYWDIATTFDWFTRGGWSNRTNIRYNLRYNFWGGLNTNITHFFTGEPSDPGYTTQRDYNVNWTHHQNINPSTQLDVNFTWMTGSYFRNFSNDLNAILTQNIVSTATLTKSWEESNSRLSIYAYRDQNLNSGSVNEQLPSFSFTQGQIFPFKPRTKARGLTSTPGSSDETPWYQLISLSYGGQGANSHTKTVSSITTLPGVTHDTTVDSRHYGINHNIVVNMAPKLGHFTVTPSFNYNEKWYVQRTEMDSLGRPHDVGGFRAIRTYNLGLSTSTKFFGIFQPGVLGITGIRHTVTPTLSYNFSPDFSDLKYGYYSTYRDTSNQVHKYSLFGNQVYGGAPSGKSQSVSVNVGNIFEMKYASSDSVEKEKKLQLLNVNASLSYNFAADHFRFSPISLSYRTDLGSYLSIAASTTHDLYVFDEQSGSRVDKLLLTEEGKLARLTSFTLGLSTSLSGQKKQSKANQGTPDAVRGGTGEGDGR